MSPKDLKTYVKSKESFTWEKTPNHIELFHKEIFNTKDADKLGLRASSILWEKIGVGGAVVPHYHDVVEIIFVTIGKVKLLINGVWKYFSAGDTFIVPSGVIHSVANNDTEPTEQISIFLPVSDQSIPNKPFSTVILKDDFTKS